MAKPRSAQAGFATQSASLSAMIGTKCEKSTGSVSAVHRYLGGSQGDEAAVDQPISRKTQFSAKDWSLAKDFTSPDSFGLRDLCFS
jgi:hypothetical protein